VEAGVFLKLWQAGVKQFDELCGIDWDWLAMDGALTKAPLGGEKNRAQSHRLTPSPASNERLLTEGHGVPIGLVAEGANRHDMKLTRPTVESLIVERPKPTAEQPQGMCLDAGYDYDEVYAILKEFGHNPRMCVRVGKRPKRSNE
jgi:putative transposase